MHDGDARHAQGRQGQGRGGWAGGAAHTATHPSLLLRVKYGGDPAYVEGVDIGIGDVANTHNATGHSVVTPPFWALALSLDNGFWVVRTLCEDKPARGFW